ncbi:CENP-B N-terminal DNA-binding domain [Popillia japonica]|uniref:CENP-B N-terminal DNA-binding domain n=1 Tax=Popillia japonica TaxID=7064 RepID=A0AAW1NCG3_POPJA
MRNYQKKITEKQNYLQDDMKLALRKIRAGRMTIDKTYNIPYPTIYSHLKGTPGAEKCARGRLTVLSYAQELELASMKKWGFGLARIRTGIDEKMGLWPI